MVNDRGTAIWSNGDDFLGLGGWGGGRFFNRFFFSPENEHKFDVEEYVLVDDFPGSKMILPVSRLCV